MAVLPADIVADILSRLSVEPLLRFRSVSKIWCALIDSDYFIKLHLRRSNHAKSNRKLLLRGSQIIESLTLDSLEVAEKLDFPSGTDVEYTVVFSSRNGLVMLWTLRDTVFIWNPSTRKGQKLPPISPKCDGSLSHRVRFGYDAVSDDYKVFKLDHFKYPHGFESEIQVYSLKSNTWHTIKDFPYYLLINGYDGVLAHGALHMFVAINYEEERPDLSIAAFDLATEETRLVPLPDFGAVSHVYIDMVALEGSFCIVAYAYQGSWLWDLQFLGMWVMKDYGADDESWNKLLSVAQLSAIGSFGKLFPLTYSKDGCEVLLLRDYEELIWFDLEHNAVRKTKVLGPSTLYDAMVLVQSLVPLVSGGKTHPDEQQMKDIKKEEAIEG